MLLGRTHYIRTEKMSTAITFQYSQIKSLDDFNHRIVTKTFA
ncbi:Hypothetical protein PAU_00407 [Photorhabdus asymbiotica]|uniref:Uncharacterized protein n=1 Tax=Photorhabdus asymbiotica subsp. asymbiotica (strain ATCC 43949 / 3105-77) TaxID=553480 RepID=C7BIZ6_PHOAA|nr:Hypothetical protein PAU_00407 [Photorhabdus asymbiotica]